MNSLTSQQPGIIGSTVINSNGSNRKLGGGIGPAQPANPLLGTMQDDMGLFPGKRRHDGV